MGFVKSPKHATDWILEMPPAQSQRFCLPVATIAQSTTTHVQRQAAPASASLEHRNSAATADAGPVTQNADGESVRDKVVLAPILATAVFAESRRVPVPMVDGQVGVSASEREAASRAIANGAETRVRRDVPISVSGVIASTKIAPDRTCSRAVDVARSPEAAQTVSGRPGHRAAMRGNAPLDPRELVETVGSVLVTLSVSGATALARTAQAAMSRTVVGADFRAGSATMETGPNGEHVRMRDNVTRVAKRPVELAASASAAINAYGVLVSVTVPA